MSLGVLAHLNKSILLVLGVELRIEAHDDLGHGLILLNGDLDRLAVELKIDVFIIVSDGIVHDDIDGDVNFLLNERKMKKVKRLVFGSFLGNESERVQQIHSRTRYRQSWYITGRRRDWSRNSCWNRRRPSRIHQQKWE